MGNIITSCHRTEGDMERGPIAGSIKPRILFTRGRIYPDQHYIQDVLQPHLLPFLKTLANLHF